MKLSPAMALPCLAVSLLLSLTACGSNTAPGTSPSPSAPAPAPSSTEAPPAAVRTVTDAVGNVVEVPAEVKHIAVAPLPWSSVVAAMDGGSQRLSAINPAALGVYKDSFFETLDAPYGSVDTSSVDKSFSFNIENLLNQGVEAALIWDYQDADAVKLKEVGIAPIMIKNDTVENLEKSFNAVGQLLGKEDRAAALSQQYRDVVQQLEGYQDKLTGVERPRVLFLRSSDLKLQGNDNFMKTAFDLAGGENVAPDDKELSMEQIVAINPDLILLSNFDPFVPDDLFNNTIKGQDWSGVKAVQEKRVYKTPNGIYRWDAPGVETPLMMQWMAKLFQPEVFSDIDFDGDLATFYKDLYGHDTTDADRAQIFNQQANAHSSSPIS